MARRKDGLVIGDGVWLSCRIKSREEVVERHSRRVDKSPQHLTIPFPPNQNLCMEDCF
jgi:hypothetical protein